MNTLIRVSFLILLMLLASCSSHHQSPAFNVETTHLQNTHSKLASVKGGQIEYYRFGQGKPIVLIAGFLTDISSWNQAFLSALCENHEVIIFNNRNVGRSYVAANHYEMKEMAEDVSQLIDDLQLKKPTVIGLSMGGMIAEELAVIAPQKINKLILMNTAIAGKEAILPSPATQDELLNMPNNKIGRYFLAIKLFFPQSTKTQMAYVLATDRFVPGDYIEIEPNKVRAQQKEVLFKWAEDNKSAKQIAKINLPVLIINGEADEVIPPKNSEIIHQKIKKSRLLRWRDAGHAINYQHPKEVAEEILTFMAQK